MGKGHGTENSVTWTGVQAGRNKGKPPHNSLSLGILVELPTLGLHMLDMRGHEMTNAIGQDILEILFCPR